MVKALEELVFGLVRNVIRVALIASHSDINHIPTPYMCRVYNQIVVVVVADHLGYIVIILVKRS